MPDVFMQDVVEKKQYKSIKVDRTTKPPVGTPLRSDGHWSVQGLEGAWVFNERSGLVSLDAVGNFNGTIGPQTKFTPNGISCTKTWNNQTGLVVQGMPDYTAQHTFVILFAPTDSGSVASKTDGVTANWILNMTSMSNIELHNSWNGPLSAPIKSGLNSVVFTWDNFYSNLWSNGVYASSKLFSSRSGINGTLRVCSDGGATEAVFVASYNRVLTPDEVKSISENPYQIFEQETIYYDYNPYIQPTRKMLPIYRTRTEKPPIGVGIDWSNPLSNGLVVAQVFNESFSDVVAEYPITRSGVTTSAIGAMFSNNTSDLVYSLNNKAFMNGRATNTPFTVISSGVPVLTGGKSCTLFSSGMVSATSYSQSVFINSTGFLVYAYNGTGGQDSSGLAVTSGNRHTLAVSHVSNTSRMFFVDGASYQSSSVMPQGSANGSFAIGRVYNNAAPEANSGYVGSMEYLYYFNRALTPEEIKSLSENPWQLFMPEIVGYKPIQYKLKPIYADWDSKPPVGTKLRSDGHWGVDGLSYCWAFNEGSGKTVFDVVSEYSGVVESTVRWAGSSLVSNGLTDDSRAVNIRLNQSLTGPRTIVTTGDFSKQNQYMLLGVDEIQFNLSAGSLNYYVLTEDGTTAVWGSTVTEKIYSCAFTGNPNAQWLPRLYVNGKDVTNTWMDNGVSFSISTAEQLGSVNGPMDQLYIYNSILTPDQVKSISENPWQIYEPRIIGYKWVEKPVLPSKPLLLLDRTEKPPIGTKLRSDGHWSVQGLCNAFGSSGYTDVARMVNPMYKSGIYDVAAGLKANGVHPQELKFPLQTGLGMNPYVLIVAKVIWNGPNAFLEQQTVYSGPLIDFWIKNDGCLRCTRTVSGGAYPSVTSAQTVPIGIPTQIAVEFNGVGKLLRAFINGKECSYAENTVDAGTLSDYSAKSPNLFSNTSNVYSYTFTGILEYLLTYTSKPFDVLSLLENPWQIYEPLPVYQTSEFTAPEIIQLIQAGYRFRKDDGSEITASWLAAQDTPVTNPNGPMRLRFLIDSTGDNTGKQFQLEYRKVGDTTWTKV